MSDALYRLSYTPVFSELADVELSRPDDGADEPRVAAVVTLLEPTRVGLEEDFELAGAQHARTGVVPGGVRLPIDFDRPGLLGGLTFQNRRVNRVHEDHGAAGADFLGQVGRQNGVQNLRQGESAHGDRHEH